MARVLRPYTGGLFHLELENGSDPVPVGFVSGIDGGHFKADEVKWMAGHDHYLVSKYPGKPKYEDITLTVGMATSSSFWDWVQASLDNQPERRSGAIVGFDHKMRERQRRTFKNALITEIGFPGLDGSSKAAAQLTLKISPEQLSFDDPSKSKNQKGPGYAQGEMTKQKRWLACNFKFSLERFSGDASFRHSKIEGFAVKIGVLNNPMGQFLETQKEPGKLEIPNLQVSFPMADVKPWMEWYDKAIVKGNWPKEMTTGSIVYYAADPDHTELMTLKLDGVGLTALEFEKMEAHKEGIAKVKATLTVEGMTLEEGDGTV